MFNFIRQPKHRYRFCQILLNGLILTLSFCVCIPMGWTTKSFYSECLLHADLVVSRQINTSLVVLAGGSIWGDPSVCGFVTYSPVVAAAHSFIWIWFYVQMQEISADSQALPALIFSCILHACFALVFLISSAMISSGLNEFCNNLENKLALSCQELEKMRWSILEEGTKFYTNVKTAEVCSWLLTVFSCVQSAVAGHKALSVVKELQGTDDKTKDSFLSGKQFGSSHFFLDDDSLSSDSRRSFSTCISSEKNEIV